MILKLEFTIFFGNPACVLPIMIECLHSAESSITMVTLWEI